MRGPEKGRGASPVCQSRGCTTAASRAPGLATPAHAPLSQPRTPSRRPGALLPLQTAAGSQLPLPAESRSGTSACGPGCPLALACGLGACSRPAEEPGAGGGSRSPEDVRKSVRTSRPLASRWPWTVQRATATRLLRPHSVSGSSSFASGPVLVTAPGGGREARSRAYRRARHGQRGAPCAPPSRVGPAAATGAASGPQREPN